MEAWFCRDVAPEHEVNNEDERLGLMHDLMKNLAQSTRLVADLQGVNNEMRAEHIELQGRTRDLELNRF